MRTLAVCVLCAACGGSGDATGIDLEIHYDPSLGLDRIAITATAGLAIVADRTVLPADARPLSATGEEGLLILLPDEIAGQPISVRVDGLVGDTVAASGRADVLARSERLVEAVVVLGDPGVCGDGSLSTDSEECDDANDEPGDGCSATCGVEEDWVCSTADGAPSRCASCDGWDWGTTNFTPCGEDGLPAPSAELVLDEDGVYTLDTDEGTLTAPGGGAIDLASDEASQPGGPTLRRVSVAGLTIEPGATLRATGGDALLLAVWGDATVSGDIDVSAQAAVAGPGGGAAGVCGGVAAEAGGAAGNDVSG
ncbi:MAG TPA: hypothetical protein VMZ28_19705, partial [Kofleriaceae bacterium]|nr:hypothetical protein [Kofleriaceae bacterium]